MGDKANALTPHLLRFLKTMASTRHVSYAHSRVAVRVANEVASQHRGTQKGPAEIGIGTILTVPLLYEPRRTFSRFGETEHEGEDFKKLVQEVDRRAQSQLLVSIHEAFERLLKGISPYFFYCHRKALAEDGCPLPFRRKEFHASARSKSWRKLTGTLDYFKQYVQWLTSRDCKDLLADLTKGFSEFEKQARTGWQHGDALEWLRLVEFCRHRIVHNESMYGAVHRNEFSRPLQRVLKGITHRSIIEDVEMILPDHETVAHAVEGMSGLAALLYRSLSESCRMKMDFPAAGTVWAMTATKRRGQSNGEGK